MTHPTDAELDAWPLNHRIGRLIDAARDRNRLEQELSHTLSQWHASEADWLEHQERDRGRIIELQAELERVTKERDAKARELQQLSIAHASAYDTGQTLARRCGAAENERDDLRRRLTPLHCRECNYTPGLPINCVHCGADHCMTRDEYVYEPVKEAKGEK